MWARGSSGSTELIALARRGGCSPWVSPTPPTRRAPSTAAGADVLVARCGVTVGGLSGPTAALLVAARPPRSSRRSSRRLAPSNPEILVLAHGGPWVTPEDTDELYAQTDAQGFLGESSIERIPIEDGGRRGGPRVQAATPARVGARASWRSPRQPDRWPIYTRRHAPHRALAVGRDRRFRVLRAGRARGPPARDRRQQWSDRVLGHVPGRTRPRDSASSSAPRRTSD